MRPKRIHWGNLSPHARANASANHSRIFPFRNMIMALSPLEPRSNFQLASLASSRSVPPRPGHRQLSQNGLQTARGCVMAIMWISRCCTVPHSPDRLAAGVGTYLGALHSPPLPCSHALSFAPGPRSHAHRSCLVPIISGAPHTANLRPISQRTIHLRLHSRLPLQLGRTIPLASSQPFSVAYPLPCKSAIAGQGLLLSP